MISLGPLSTIGAGARGLTRLAWTTELAQAEAWFAAQADDAGLRVQRDPAGNLWACPPVPPPWWGVGSHLDTVREGGAYDGALGVVCGFEAVRRSRVPVAVISFADEEGARFNTPTFGSRALVGRPHEVGEEAAEAMRDFGVDPSGLARAPQWLERLRGFLELHIDQSREIWEMGVAVAGVSGLAARARVHALLEGEADHAGTTPMEGRRDALRAAAELIIEATDVPPPMRATATRIRTEPDALSTIPGRAQVWLDARAPSGADLDAWLARVGGRVESRSDGVSFDRRVRAALGGPEVVCFAGHDAGILAERIPAGMLLVRNERGVSHAPDEEIDLADAEAGVGRMVRALEALA